MNTLPTKTVSYAAEGISHLQLHTWAGDIEIVGHEDDSIKVEVYLSIRSILSLFLEREAVAEFDPEIYELHIEQIDSTLKITAKPNYFHPYSWFNFPQMAFRVYLPAAIHSNAKTFGGKISLRNAKGTHVFSTWGGNLLLTDTRGDLKGKTMGGKVEVIKCAGKVTVKTMGGNLFLSDNQGEITASTMGGNVSVLQHKGQLHATTWGGNINANDVYGGFECTTAGGNIRLHNMNGNIGASTKGGNISAHVLTIDQYAWFDTAGGKVNAALPLDKGLDLEVSANRIYHPPFQSFEGYATRRSIRGKLNGGGPNITIKTTGGRVNLAISQPQNTSTDFQASPTTPPQNQNYVHKPPPFKSQKKTTVKIEKTVSSSLSELLLAFAFCLLLCYGLSSVVYFVLEAVNPKSPLALINKGVFYSNIANSFATFCSIYTFIYLIDNRIRFEIVKYAVLIGLTFLYVSMFQWLVWWAYWRHINVESFSKDQNNGSLLFGFIPHIVSCLYFAYWQRTRHISRKISEQEYQLLNLEKLKTKAQLNALEARINPHFLYNSLNSIAGLVHQDPDKAEEMTIQLSKLFRYSTGRSEGHSHSIAEELEVVKSYLAIEQMRFGNRLQFSVEVTPELMYLKIPRFLLQPIVENAIKHGISQLLGNGKIEIKITQEGKLIQFTIHDNGPAFKEAIGGGYGLRSIKDKLNLFYGEKAQLQIQNNHYKAVCITLPMDDEPIEFR